MSVPLIINNLKSERETTDYSGIILIPFEVEVIGEREGNQIVKFQSDSKIAKEAIFVKNVKELKKEEGGNNDNPVFTASKVENPVGEATWDGNGKIPLLAIHGFMGRPDVWYDWCQQAIDSEFKDKKILFFIPGEKSKFNLVPVMWPSNLSITNKGYFKGRENATAAGKSFAERLSRDDVKTSKKSIISVSMGNFVLKEMANAAHEKKQSLSFENVFMNAADVDEDIFSSVDKEGANIVDMLAKNGMGKVYVFYNKYDIILQGSTNLFPEDEVETNSKYLKNLLLNPFAIKDKEKVVRNIFSTTSLPDSPMKRLGIHGAQNIAKEFEGKVENKNASKFGNVDLGHGYVFYPEVVDIYNDPSKSFKEENFVNLTWDYWGRIVGADYWKELAWDYWERFVGGKRFLGLK